MQSALAFIVVNIFALCNCHEVNYCGGKMCAYTNAHTFCQYPPGPSQNCRGYMGGQLTAEEKVRVVSRLNQRRSEAASGRLRRLGTAGNMLKLRWVEELAREAQRWADQCRPPRTPDERDACRDLYSTSVGQCVASVVGEAPGLRVESMVDMWYMQSMRYKGNATHYIAPISNVSYYGDFAQMVWARSYMVGCGRSRFMSDWNGRMRSVERLVCNIAPQGPEQYRALWAPAVPTSVCPPRSIPDLELPSMCNYQKNLDASADVDGAMTIEEHILLSLVLEIEDKPILNQLGSLDELYMAKLAVVTMDNLATTISYHKAARKRDIIDTLGLYGNIVHMDDVIVNNDVNKLITATRIFVKLNLDTTESQKSMTSKVILIGRPKSYNIEDLNNVDGGENLQKDNFPDNLLRVENTKTYQDLYFEYEILDDSKESVINVTERASISNDIILNKFNVSNINNDIFGSSAATERFSVYYEIEENRTINDTEKVNISDSLHSDFTNIPININTSTDNSATSSDDDDLTDSETVRELQEALERMENSLEENKPGKVRRELRGENLQELPKDVINEDIRNADDEDKVDSKPDNSQNDAVIKRNNSDRNPMLGIVLKYMPYLKPYENEILGTSSTGHKFDSSYVLKYFVFVFIVLLVCA